MMTRESLGDGPPMEADRPQWHTKVNCPRDKGQGLARRRGHVEVDTLVTVSVSPGTELVSILGVECQTVDVVRRGSSGNPNNIIPSQIDCFPLDLIFENCMDATVKHRVLIRIVHFHCPYKALVDHFNSFRETIEVTIFKISSLIRVSKWPGLRSARLVDRRSHTVHIRSTTAQ